MVFLLTATLAEACRRHLDLSLQRFGTLGDIVAALMVTLWAFEAHTRYAFRGRRPRSWPEGRLRFLAASWTCLAVQAAALRLAPVAGDAVWLLATVLSFTFARDQIWVVRSQAPQRAPHDP